MSPDATGKSRPGALKAPNLVLRRIREEERHETRGEFAESMARMAREMGEGVFPDIKYVARLEAGDIRYPRPVYRRILSELCGRPFGELGFSSPPGLSVTDDRDPGEGPDRPTAAKRMNIRLRDAVLDCGLELEQIARKVGVDPKSVQRWVTGGVVPHPRHRWKACKVLGLDESELWPGVADIKSEAVESAAEDITFQLDGDEIVKRRTFLMNLAAAAGVSGLQASLALEEMRHEISFILDGGSADATPDQWHEIALEYGELYQRSSPLEVLGRLIIDLDQLRSAVVRYRSDAAQREFRIAGAYLAAFMAITLANLDRAEDSHRWWRTARRAADTCGDPGTALWIRSREVIQAWYGNRPVSALLCLVDEAEARIGKSVPPAVMSEFLSGKAQVMAVIGPSHAGQAENALSTLREAFASIQGTSAGDRRDSLLFYSEDCLRYTESLVYTFLGDHRKADAAQGAARSLYSMTYQRGTIQIELHSALSLIRSGDISQGIGHAQNVLEDIPEACRVESVTDLSKRILRAVPERERKLEAVQAYRDFLAVSFTT